MQAHVVTQITIDATPEDVFKYLGHLKYHHLWNPQLQKISHKSQLALGMEYKTTSQILGVKLHSNNVITKYKSLREIEVSNNTGTVKYRANFKLIPAVEGTILKCTTTVSSDNEAFAFAKPVLQMLAKRELQTDMQALKIAVENRLT